MGLFSSKKKSCLGVDLGGESIKMVELTNNKGKAKLSTYGIGERNVRSVGKDKEENVDEVVKLLLDVYKKSNAKSTDVITALPTFAVFSSIITLPEIPKKELAAAISWEAKKVIPLPLDEMIFQWEILPSLEETIAETKTKGGIFQKEKNLVINKKENKYLKILLTAAPRTLVQRYVEIFKKAGLNLLSLETESIALTRALIGGDKSLVMLVDIGAVNTNISVIDQGVPLFNRGIDAGSLSITNSIKKSLNLSTEYSEQFKRDLALYTLNSKTDLVMPSSFELVLSPIINEIKYIHNLFSAENNELRLSNGNAKIEKIILTGGASVLPYLIQHLTKVLDIRVILGDPWARVNYPDDLQYLLEEIGPKLSIAIGLAMRDVF